MTAQAGAILNTSSAWDAVDWRSIEDTVRRLQARIVKAVQQKKWNKVRALQRLLTRCDEELKNSNANDFIPSFCPRRPAYRRKRTPLKTQAAMGV